MASSRASSVSVEPGRPGRPGCEERAHFTIAADRDFGVCMHCDAAYTAAPCGVNTPVKVRNRKDAFERHLKKCAFFKRARMLENVTQPITESPPPKSTCNPPPTLADIPDQAVAFKKRKTTREEQDAYDLVVLEFQVDNNLPDSFIERQTTLDFIAATRMYNEAAIPKRRELGGRILLQAAATAKCEDMQSLSKLQAKTGGRVNFLSDVWQNCSKTHVLGCQLSLFGSVNTYALKPVSSRHDALAIAEMLEMTILEATAEGWVVGAVLTDDAGQCGRARRILILRWPRIAFLRCFAHDINNLVKGVLQTAFFSVTNDAAAIATALNNSSSKWLVRARDQLTSTYGYSLSIFTLCETRWNSMQSCFASILRVKSGLQSFAFNYREDKEFPAALKKLGSSWFWEDLANAEAAIRPLCNASYRLQRDENTVADVVISYRDIFKGFAAISFDEADEDDVERRNSLLDSVEKRWLKCEQPLFLLGLFLHPVHLRDARELHFTGIVSLDTVCDAAVYYYRRFVGDDFGTVRMDMLEWIDGDFTHSTPEEFDNSVWKFWHYLQRTRTQSKLPSLAIAILSIAVNTATCERLFSELALIHTNRRNRLGVEKTSNVHQVKKKVRDRQKRERDIASRARSSPEAASRTKKPFVGRIVNPVERTRPSSPEDIAFEEFLGSDAADSHALGAPRAWDNAFAARSEDAESEANQDEAHTEPRLGTLASDGNGALADGSQALRVHSGPLHLQHLLHPTQTTHAVTSADHCIPSARPNYALEAIPPPDRRAFSATNDRNFPQESKVRGIRGLKVTLESLFGRPAPMDHVSRGPSPLQSMASPGNSLRLDFRRR